MKTGWTGPYYRGDLAFVNTGDYQSMVGGGIAEPVCTDDPVVQRQALVSAAAALDVTLSGVDEPTAEVAATYGVTAHRSRKRGG